MTFPEQSVFLKQEYLPLLRQLRSDTPAQWGKMDAQQMVEHILDAFKNASGKIIIPFIEQDPERLQKMREFILSDKPFRENTKAPFMPEAPPAHQYNSLKEAIEHLEPEIQDFFSFYENNPGAEVLNPVLGELNVELQMALLYKHTTHHLRQFGVVV